MYCTVLYYYSLIWDFQSLLYFISGSSLDGIINWRDGCILLVSPVSIYTPFCVSKSITSTRLRACSFSVRLYQRRRAQRKKLSQSVSISLFINSLLILESEQSFLTNIFSLWNWRSKYICRENWIFSLKLRCGSFRKDLPKYRYRCYL